MVNMGIFTGIETVIWDCDETLWFYRKDEIELVAEALQIPVTSEFNYQYFNMLSKFDSIFAKQKASYAKLEKLVELAMPILLFYNMTAKEFISKWLPIENSCLNEHSLETLKTLHEQGLKNIILTDWFYEPQVKRLESYGILPYIDRVYSCDNEYLKKNPKTAPRIIKPGSEESYVIVGDSLSNDIAFAQHAKIRSIWYNRHHKPNTTQFIPTIEVSSLLEIPKILS